MPQPQLAVLLHFSGPSATFQGEIAVSELPRLTDLSDMLVAKGERGEFFKVMNLYFYTGFRWIKSWRKSRCLHSLPGPTDSTFTNGS